MEQAITLTTQAVSKVKELQTKERAKDPALRISIKTGGCAGMSYALAFDKKAKNDVVIKDRGVTILVDKSDLDYLEGIELDYVDSLQGSGFKFHNPKAKSGCGCGNSFSA